MFGLTCACQAVAGTRGEFETADQRTGRRDFVCISDCNAGISDTGSTGDGRFAITTEY